MLSQEQLKAKLKYDPLTGLFTVHSAIGSRGRKIGGRLAGGVNKVNGYVEIWVNGKSYTGHRLAFLYMTGKFPDSGVDHFDLIRSNNKWENLRVASQLQNTWNMPVQKSNTSGFKGVSKRKDTGKWTARIKHNNSYVSLGCFDRIEDAAIAYKTTAVQLRGEFARC